MFELVFFLCRCRVERKLLKINKKSFDLFLKKKMKDGKISFS